MYSSPYAVFTYITFSVVELFDALITEFNANCTALVVCPHCAASGMYHIKTR